MAHDLSDSKARVFDYGKGCPENERAASIAQAGYAELKSAFIVLPGKNVPTSPPVFLPADHKDHLYTKKVDTGWALLPEPALRDFAVRLFGNSLETFRERPNREKPACFCCELGRSKMIKERLVLTFPQNLGNRPITCQLVLKYDFVVNLLERSSLFGNRAN